jgi:hypothetical protein
MGPPLALVRNAGSGRDLYKRMRDGGFTSVRRYLRGGLVMN